MATAKTIRGHKPKVDIPVEPEVNDPLNEPEPTPEIPVEPETSSEVVSPSLHAEFTKDDLGRYVAMDGTKDLFVTIGGCRYEHVGEDPEGRWIYGKS